ncbi:MAG: M20/M25/M40 family metallo-hydrolase [Kiritimatiellae bacterium]|nr:M20/M25/M40 family metallo-hydrolase [Kiritimatiellia bacterium]
MNVVMEDWLKSQDSKEYFELLQFPTIGADPAHLKDCVSAAMWLKKWLEKIGAEAELLLPQGAAKQNSNASVPVVYGELKGAEGSTTVLVYGHYDVQPPDPLELWESAPFEPTVKNERVYCRGAQDDKGQIFAFLCGIRELIAAKHSPMPTIKFLLDGQEESGSGAIFALLKEKEFQRKIAADVLLVSDTNAAADLRPAIVAGLRGVNHFTVKLTAANRDLHSGEYGGLAPNAAQGMAQLMSSLHNADGSIAVEGFCDGIEPPTQEEFAAAQASFASIEAYEADIGTKPCGGEASLPAVKRVSFEPTIEINGIHTGYGGPGSKTVIPCQAIAKLSTRLVPGQNPLRTFEAIKEHLKAKCPDGMVVSFPEDSGLSSALRLALTSPIFSLAQDILSQMDKRGAAFLWNGASIPVVAALRDATCAAPLLVGWGQPEDRIHSPNESFSVKQFAASKEWAKRIIAEL